MSSELTNQPPKGRFSFSLSSRTRSALLWVLFVTCYVLGFAYHWVTVGAPEPLSGLLTFVYNLLVVAGYGALWVLLSQYYRARRSAPVRTLWITLFAGVLFFGLSYVTIRLAPPPVLPSDAVISGDQRIDFFFAPDTGYPFSWPIVVIMNVVSLLGATFAFLLLLHLRGLVLFKRTKSSQRNWRLMLGLMLLAAVTVFTKPVGAEQTTLQDMAIVPPFVMMVVNSLRLSWIVFLSFKEKVATIGLSLLLLIVLVGVFSQISLVEVYPYIEHYSNPLAVFTDLAIIFGILYCVTAFLSLLFHLPTTSDFQQRAGEMAAMHSLTAMVSQVLDTERLLATITASPVDAGSAHTSWLAIAAPQSGTLEPQIVAPHNTTTARVNELVDVGAFYRDLYLTCEPLCLQQAPLDHRVQARPGDGLGSMLVLPLVARDDMLGALFTTKEVAHGFEDDDIEAISVFAAQAALALDNARLFEEQLEKERLARELAIAHEVQLKLLPQRLPQLEGATLAASSISAQEVGGDYYDFVRLDEHRLGIIIADVSGKGTSAAFYMAEMQGIFKSVSRIAPDPVDFLYNANAALVGSLEKNVFISVIYGVLDTREETFVFARAGHCPAAMTRLNGEARFLRSSGLGLGLDRGPLFRRTLAQEEIKLQPGDVFMFYTDGIVESRSEAGEEYGYDRLLEIIAANRHEDADDLHTLLLNDLNRFIGPNKDYDDDLTLVVLKWHGIDLAQRSSRDGGRQQPVPSPFEADESAS